MARYPRLIEVGGLLCLVLGLALWLSLVSYHPTDPSWNTATGVARARNLIGPAGAWAADLSYQVFGLLAFGIPVGLVLVAWNWVRGRSIEAPLVRVFGGILLLLSACSAFALGPKWTLFGGSVLPGGFAGSVLAAYLMEGFNYTGALLVTCAALLVAIYLSTSFRLSHLSFALAVPAFVFRPVTRAWRAWRDRPRAPKVKRERKPAPEAEPEPDLPPAPETFTAAVADPVSTDTPPWESEEEPPAAAEEEIPIRTIEDLEPPPGPTLVPPVEPEPPEPPARTPAPAAKTAAPHHPQYVLPPTGLLSEVPARSPFDEEELKQTAARIKSKFEEFHVLGSVVQINPGPVVTTFEFKPEAGIKYSRITGLAEDLCLGLQAESIIIERIPGKPTVGIEVPNKRRELISLRQILESDEFAGSQSHLTIPLGKDASGRIKVSPLETMPHLLIAGSTGSGKSVMLNTLIMSLLYKSTPDEVRMILVDPKRLEMGLYEGIPHLLTPVITDSKKATNALRNAVLEMERRLRLLASQGVRNIEQFNRKVRQLRNEPIPMFEEDAADTPEELEPLPQILILIDELADLMMVEGHNVEQSVTRLAQMARAVGMHLVLATQRPSVDVITGLIKANFPARISFRVATRVDSRTVLDVMGAEHLLGKGDMLFLPPGSSRLVRVHAAFITESEINRVVEFWKAQATPDYDQSFLVAPPEEDGEEGAPADDFSGEEDPLYRDAVRVVLEMGKASTSTLQRRLRLGYGRAARILDMMQRDGLIGPPDGSKPREVLKRPDWLDEIDRERLD
ncbi:MAG TPA: DNA translocase FtsK [Bryobacteraceae bacterium]|nr:DNA translocase FtsK [Bryobacteraceae bacterium]